MIRKFKGIDISDRKPKAGDIVICVDPNSPHYLVKFGPLTRTNTLFVDPEVWKVVV